MGIFLRQSHNVKPLRWGSFADVQYAIRVNSEKIYGCDPDDDVLIIPGFWGLPPLDYSGYGNHGTNHGATYKDGSLDFDGGDDYGSILDSTSLDITGNITLGGRAYSHTYGYEVEVGNLWGRLLRKGANYDLMITDNANENEAIMFKWAGSNVYWENVITLNIWQFVSLSISGNTATLYIDGISQGNKTVTGRTANADPLIIANYDAGTIPRYFNGLIDEVRISKATCTADQIALFHDRPWDLYRRVARPIWSIPAEPSIYIPRIIMF